MHVLIFSVLLYVLIGTYTSNAHICKVLLYVLIGTNISNAHICKDDSTLLRQVVSMATRETATICVYDDSHDGISSVVTVMAESNRPMLMYEYQSFYGFLGPHMKTLMENTTSEAEYRSRLHFMVLCGRKCVKDLMTYATKLDDTIGQGSLLRHFSTWLIISDDPPPHLDIPLDNVAVINISQGNLPFTRNSSYLKPTFPNFGVEKERSTTPTYWSASFDTFHNSSSCLTVAVYTLLWTLRGREWSRVYINNVSNDQLNDLIFPNTQNGLNGRQLRLATLEWRPYTQRNVIKGKVGYVGAGVDVINMLSWKFNFSYVIVEPEDMLWGQELENGSYSGILGMMKRAEIDACPAPYAISFGRKKIMDFTSTVKASEYSLVYRRRIDTVHSWLSHLSCFSWPVYLCGMTSLLWVVLLLGCLHNQTDVSKVIPKKEDTHLICFEAGINVPLHQPILMVPTSISTRVLISTWCLFCLVVLSVYTGNLVAFATVDKYKPPFTTLQELAEQNDYEIGVLEGGYGESILMSTDDPLLKSIYKKVVKDDNNSTSVLRYINRVLDEKYVLLAQPTEKDIIRSLTCEIVEMKEKLFPLHSGFAFPRYSPLKHLFDKQVMQIRELGIFTTLELKWTPKALNCDSPRHVPQVKLGSLKTVLIMCLVCVMIAGMVLLVEKWKVK